MSIEYLESLYIKNDISINLYRENDQQLEDLVRFQEQLLNEIELNYVSDMDLQDLASFMRRIIYKLSLSLESLNNVVSEDTIEEFKKVAGKIYNYYPQIFKNYIEPYAKILSELSTRETNPIYIKLRDVVEVNEKKNIAIVTKSALKSKEKEIINQFNNVAQYTNTSFRKLKKTFDICIYIGSPQLFGLYSSTVFKAPEIHFISYSFYREQALRDKILYRNSENYYSNIIDQYSMVKYGEEFKKNTTLSDDEIYKENLTLATRNHIEKNNESQGIDNVRTITFILENDRFVFVPYDKKIRVFNAYKENSLVSEKNTREVQEEEYVILNNEREVNIIKDLADKELGGRAHEYRLLQNEWKEKLKELIKASTIENVASELKKIYGMETAKVNNIKNWLEEDFISPHEIINLLEALDYNESEISHTKKALDEIKGAHIKAGRYITKTLTEELTSDIQGILDEKGFYEFKSKTIMGASFNIERVVSIDNKRVFVKPHSLLKPIKI